MKDESIPDMIERLRKEHEVKSRDTARQAALDKSKGIGDDVAATSRFVQELIATCFWLWQRVGEPVRKALWRWPVKPAGLAYMRLWHRTTHVRNSFGDDIFSRCRAGGMVAATLVVLWLIPSIMSFTWDLSVFLTTRQYEEVLYLSLPEEISDDVHAVRGCSTIECSDDQTFYFRVEGSAFNHLWSWLNRGHQFYPDLVASVVTPGLNRCIVHASYGFRAKPFIQRDIFPELLSATCTAIARNEADVKAP